MQINHLQSLIKRNSSRIAELEELLRWSLSTKLAKEKTMAKLIRKTRKEIAALAKLQRILKEEIACQIYTAKNFNFCY